MTSSTPTSTSTNGQPARAAHKSKLIWLAGIAAVASLVVNGIAVYAVMERNISYRAQDQDLAGREQHLRDDTVSVATQKEAFAAKLKLQATLESDIKGKQSALDDLKYQFDGKSVELDQLRADLEKLSTALKKTQDD